MSDIKETIISGNGSAVHFHEDGSFIRKELKANATSIEYGTVCDLGESLGGVTMRIVAESALAGLSTSNVISFSILGGNDASTTPATWETLATITAEKDYAAGDTIGAFTPPPGTGKKFYVASVTNSAGATGTVSVWNELTR